MDRVSPNLYAFIQLPKEALFAGKFLTTLHLCRNERKRDLVVVWAVLYRYFRFSGVSETEMVSFEAVDASMIGCSTSYDS